jgi:hypothetical protein
MTASAALRQSPLRVSFARPALPRRRYSAAATNATTPNATHAHDQPNGPHNHSQSPPDDHQQHAPEEGALTRRLRALTDDALSEPGFSPELKAQLEQRIAAANLRSSPADLPSATPRHAQDLATTPAWTGTESIHDASLRMLNDAHKPMRMGRPPRAPGVQMPTSIDTGRKRGKAVPGLRLANARDRSGLYASVKDDDTLEQTDRERRLQELKERFEPGARTIVPGSIQGLASLANKRIEDAIARGQFKNIPRGKGTNVERDHNANSPFIDTTEYFMNKIIQRQEIVPPWIEKQQELASAVNKLRSTLRIDWKRHAARMIASQGGSLQDQIRRAHAYAKAEEIVNPSVKKPSTPVDSNKQAVLLDASTSTSPSASTNQETALDVDKDKNKNKNTPLAPTQQEGEAEEEALLASPPSSPAVLPARFPFRDPDWERTETPYLTVAIKDLNDKTRSYNLQAPELAKKPYFKLDRELSACYAAVAPQLAEAILDRARKPVKKAESFGQTLGERSLFGGLGGGPVRVRDERTTKQYGFRQFWNDLFADKPKSPY